MNGLGKGKLIEVVELAQKKELEGYEDLPTKKEMTAGSFSKEDVTRLLAETLDLTAAQVSYFAKAFPMLPTPPPTTRSTLRRQSPPRVRSPTSSASSPAEVADGRSPDGLGPFAEEHGSMIRDGVETEDERLLRVAQRSPGGFST